MENNIEYRSFWKEEDSRGNQGRLLYNLNYKINKMENYIGVKELSAKEMNLGDYNKYRGWTIPINEDPTREGYLVKYEDGYESWSPKEVFEKSYFKPIALAIIKENALPHEERIINEAKELLEKIEKLNDFITNNKIFTTLQETQKNLLKVQLTSMRYYYSVLYLRLS